MNSKIDGVKFNNFEPTDRVAYSLSDPLKDKIKQPTQSAFVAYNANPEGYVNTSGISVFTDSANA